MSLGKSLLRAEERNIYFSMSKTTDVSMNEIDIKDKIDNKSEDEEELRCGFGKCTPQFLQIFNNPKIFLICLCWFSVVQGFVVNGINNVNTTSFERRFNLQSSQVGWISSIYDVAAGLLVIPFTYFGNYAHQPRLLGIGAFVMSLGSFVMTIPHFATGSYQPKLVTEGCALNSTSSLDTCDSSDNDLTWYLYVLMLGQVLHAVGGSVLYSLGIVFIDGNVSTRSSPVYIAFVNTCGVLGPALGYIGGGQIIDILYVDFDTGGPTSKISNKDPGWVGAWWLGFMIAGFAGLIGSLSFFPFPRELPQAKVVKATRVTQAHHDGSEEVCDEDGFGSSIRDMPKAAKILFMNPTNMLVTCAGITEGFATAGFATFLAKFIQNQFDQPAGTAATYSGLVVVLGGGFGIIIGGSIVNCGKLKVQGMLRMCITLMVCSGITSLIFFLGCPVLPIVGVNTSYENSSLPLSQVNMESTCSNNCGCTTKSYEPICDVVNDVTYFSACYAGCTSSNIDADNIKVYHNCSCLGQPLSPNSSIAQAKDGICKSGCNLLPIAMVGFMANVLISFMSVVPSTQVSLRCVPHSQRAFALGIKWVFVRFLGTFPGPLVMGALLDSTCLVNKCSESGSCWIYDNYRFGLYIAITALVIKCLSTLFYVMAYIFYKPPKDEVILEKDIPKLKESKQPLDGVDNKAVELNDWL